MACYHPLKAFRVGTLPSGKAQLKVVPYDVQHIELWPNEVWQYCGTRTRSRQALHAYYDWQEIPCGQCIGCRLEYSRQWANRCVLELDYCDEAYFVTLTYNDEHVPMSWYADQDTGEAFQAMTLRKRELQGFFKRLRLYSGQDNLRYYSAGEYGAKYMRPHYHCIIFGLHLDDLQLLKSTPDGWQYYRSPLVESAWMESKGKGRRKKGESGIPLGFVVVCRVNWSTCAYVARYVTKKLTGHLAEWYDYFNIERPFALMSRMPGLGKRWFEDHPDLDPEEYIHVKTEDEGLKFKQPRYFDYLRELEDPDCLKDVKLARRQRAMAVTQSKLARTGLSYQELLAVEERALQARITGLDRPLEQEGGDINA